MRNLRLDMTQICLFMKIFYDLQKLYWMMKKSKKLLKSQLNLQCPAPRKNGKKIDMILSTVHSSGNSENGFKIVSRRIQIMKNKRKIIIAVTFSSEQKISEIHSSLNLQVNKITFTVASLINYNFIIKNSDILCKEYKTLGSFLAEEAVRQGPVKDVFTNFSFK